MEEKKENKIAALLRKPDAMEQTAVQVVPQYNLSSDKITEGKSGVATEELATRVSGVEALIPKIDIKIGKVSKKVDNLKGSTNKKFQRITKEIDIIAEGIDDNNKRVTKLSALIQKNKKDGDKDSKKSEKGNNKIITILTNMLDFMKLTFEQDNLARDQKNNFSEEQKAEKDLKDKELLEALKALNGRGIPTAEKIDDKGKGSLWEKILGAMASILNPLKAFMSTIGKLFTTLGKIFTSLTKFIASAGRILFVASRLLLTTPVGWAILAATSIAAILLMASKEAHEESAKGMVNAGKDSALGEAITDVTEVNDENAVQKRKSNILADRPSDKKSGFFWEDSGLQKEYLKEIGWDEKTGTTKKERDSGATKIDASGNLVYPKLPAGMTMQQFDKALDREEPDAKVPVTNVKPRPTDTLKAQVWDSKYAGGWNPDGTPKNKSEPKSTETPPTPAPAPAPSTPSSSEEGMKGYKGRRSSPESAPDTPVPAPMSSATPITNTPNLGTQMATMSNENALAKTVEELAVATSSQVNNVMTATKSIVEHTTDKMPSVRNQEDTFQRMILNSTRVV
jgi:hypothetical protein